MGKAQRSSGSGHDQSLSEKSMGTRTEAAIVSFPRRAGTKRQRCTASCAALSRRVEPLLRWMRTSPGLPGHRPEPATRLCLVLPCGGTAGDRPGVDCPDRLRQNAGAAGWPGLRRLCARRLSVSAGLVAGPGGVSGVGISAGGGWVFGCAIGAAVLRSGACGRGFCCGGGDGYDSACGAGWFWCGLGDGALVSKLTLSTGMAGVSTVGRCCSNAHSRAA